MSFLSKLSQLKKVNHPTLPLSDQASQKSNNGQSVGSAKQSDLISLLPKNYAREEDPAVKRLKELRRKEMLKRGETTVKPPKRSRKTGVRRTNVTRSEVEEQPTFKRGIESIKQKSMPMTTQRSEKVALKKMTFEELMKQAENNANRPPNRTIQLEHKPSMPNSKNKISSKVSPKKEVEIRRKPTKPVGTIQQSKNQSEVTRLGLPSKSLAQPNEKLRKILAKRNQLKHGRSSNAYKNDDDDDDLEGFIEDDDEETDMSNAGYDRDEIWAIFNKGKRRHDFYDYEDGDDMEANEMEILEEEENARKMARLEDKREEMWLKKHEQEKRKRRI